MKREPNSAIIGIGQTLSYHFWDIYSSFEINCLFLERNTAWNESEGNQRCFLGRKCVASRLICWEEIWVEGFTERARVKRLSASDLGPSLEYCAWCVPGFP